MDKVPVAQLDYCFVHAAEEAGTRVTALTAIDVQTGLSIATVVTQKGSTRHALHELLQFI